MGIRHNDQLWLLDILSDSVDSCRENTRILAVLKWLWVFSRKPRSLKQTDMFFCFFLCEAISCIGDFSIFLYALSCFDLFAYAACQCMWFLHEANVAVDFSFSLLSLCDIVYWETNKQKKHSNVNKKKLFQKRILWYSLLSPFVMILVKSLFFSLPSSFFSFQKRSSLSSLMLTLGKLCLLFSTFSSFSTMLGKRACLCDTLQNLLSPLWRQESCWGSPRGTVIHTTQEIPSDQSIDASRPRSHHTAQLSSSACSCVCVLCMWEKARCAYSFSTNN